MRKTSTSYIHFVLSAILLLCGSLAAIAQQEWSNTQYLFNLYDVNSAYAGNHNTGSFALRHRSQWIGMEGAPVSQQLSFHTPSGDQLGWGIKLNHERIGARDQQFVRLTGSWKLRFEEGTLSLGLAGGIIRHGVNADKLTALDQGDIQLQQMNNNVITPVADFSAFFNTKRFYIGVDCGRINRSKINYSNNSLARLYFNSALVAGYMKRIGQSNMLQLSGLMKYSEGKLWQSEINLLYLHNNKYWIGAGYRIQCCFQLFAAINLTDHFRFGLSYDVAGKAMKGFHDGSAEVFLGYTMQTRSGKSVRYF